MAMPVAAAFPSMPNDEKRPLSKSSKPDHLPKSINHSNKQHLVTIPLNAGRIILPIFPPN